MIAESDVASAPDEHAMFALLLALARAVKGGRVFARRSGLVLDAYGELRETAPDQGWFWIDPRDESSFGAHDDASDAIQQLIDLYLPLCLQGQSWVLAHLGQSLDGHIALESGASRYVTGQENLIHVHRLRALCDAVLVGANTVECDNPQLTTRLVQGPSPVRVVLDPTLRVSAERALFHDRAAETWVLCARGRAAARRFPVGVEVIELDCDVRELSPSLVVEVLAARGKRWVFVEGGGVTVSHFLRTGALDRLHLTIAPVLLGAGIPGVSLPALSDLALALRPRTRRFHLGQDVLFDCALEPARASEPSGARP